MADTNTVESITSSANNAAGQLFDLNSSDGDVAEKAKHNATLEAMDRIQRNLAAGVDPSPEDYITLISVTESLMADDVVAKMRTLTAEQAVAYTQGITQLRIKMAELNNTLEQTAKEKYANVWEQQETQYMQTKNQAEQARAAAEVELQKTSLAGPATVNSFTGLIVQAATLINKLWPGTISNDFIEKAQEYLAEALPKNTAVTYNKINKAESNEAAPDLTPDELKLAGSLSRYANDAASWLVRIHDISQAARDTSLSSDILKSQGSDDAGIQNQNTGGGSNLGLTPQ